MRHGLERAGLVLTPNGQSQFGSPCVGLFDQLFLAAASGSLTRTTPCLRVRITTPVSHQVRLFCQLRPPACKVRQIVNVLTRGSPSGAWRKAFCSRLNDQVAVPSCSRWGVRAHSCAFRLNPFGQDALLRISAIADPWSAPMAGPHGGEPVAVEPADPGGDRLGVPSSDLVGGSRVAGAIRNGQQRSGALDLRGGGAERAAQAGQLLALLRRERAKGIFLVARHGTPRGTRITAPPYQFPRQTTH